MSVVVDSFTLQGRRGGSTVVLFFFFWFCLHYPKILWAQLKTLEGCRSRRDSPKILNVVGTPKLQLSCEYWRHNHKSLSNGDRIAFESYCVNVSNVNLFSHFSALKTKIAIPLYLPSLSNASDCEVAWSAYSSCFCTWMILGILHFLTLPLGRFASGPSVLPKDAPSPFLRPLRVLGKYPFDLISVTTFIQENGHPV